MGSAYDLGLLFGTFTAGCICGLFPLIVSLIKKRALCGLILMVISGILSFIHPVLSIATAVVSGIALCFMHKKL